MDEALVALEQRVVVALDGDVERAVQWVLGAEFLGRESFGKIKMYVVVVFGPRIDLVTLVGFQVMEILKSPIAEVRAKIFLLQMVNSVFFYF